MTTSENYESPSQQAVPAAGGFFIPEEPESDDNEVSETGTADLPEEDDERAQREQDRERRAEDPAP
jgi:hypothetical protein